MERTSADIELNEFSRLIRNAWIEKFLESDSPDNGQILSLAKNTKYDATLCLDTMFGMGDDGITTFNKYMAYCRERMKTKVKNNADFAVDENGEKHEWHIDKDNRKFYYAPKPRNEIDARLMQGFQLKSELAITRDMTKEQRNEMIGKQIEHLHKSKQFTDEMYKQAMVGMDILNGSKDIGLQADIKVNPDLF